ncbi:MAG: glycogen debranching protein GlgX [Deltaproteobacteria bacterium]|nr:glycogen debranching protein GlgX [Deltaproteobacteria bacterium]
MILRTSVGRPYPLGATVGPEGINFAIFSQHATAIYVELFTHPDDSRPAATLKLDPQTHRTGDVWHVHVYGLGHGQLYGYRADGPYAPAEEGHRFNVHKLLFDPYARALIGGYDTEHDALYGYDRRSPLGDLSFSSEDSAPYTVKSVAMAPSPFDWEQARPLRLPLEECVFYEVHVKGLSFHPSSGVGHPGSYLGVVEKIPHLVQLGVTSLELLPVHEFNADELARADPETGRPLRNYWGYSTLGFFSPEQDYAADRQPTAEVDEFRYMVKRLHQAGIEVILDVVFNHTGEGNEWGPTLGFRGLDNAVYYCLERNRYYRNYSGCGNTVQCNHPVVKQFILDCLRYWVAEMHVDGFRFDLATILGRDRRGEWIGDLSLLYDIGGDPILRGCKLIAEAWDADGMYKVGGFPHGWAEWNGRFRDDLRRFVRGDQGLVPSLARRLGGSRDLFGHKRSPAHSINFVTCHDGFTLRDLVSYEQKHNERNAEGGRDGSDDNHGHNHGVEGETDDPAVRLLRRQQAKNVIVALFLSRGTPMLLGGDEIWRTQKGNNNTYCQDNELSWFHWELDAEAQEMLRFVRLVVGLRRRHPALRRASFVDPFVGDGGGVVSLAGADIHWHGVRLGRPDWSFHSRTLALHIQGKAPPSVPTSDDADLYAVFNAWSEALSFELPHCAPPHRWHRVIDTALESPLDIVAEEEAPLVHENTYLVQPRSSILLVGR